MTKTKFKPDWWLIIGVPLGLYMWYSIICIYLMLKFSYNGGYTEQYVVEMPVDKLVQRMDSVLAVHPEYGNQSFIRTWHYKTKNRRIYPERMLRMGTDKDTVWVRLLFDSITPNITIIEVMDLNRKIRKNGIYYLWSPTINTNGAGFFRSRMVRKDIENNVLPALDVKWKNKTHWAVHLGPLYTSSRRWFIKDEYLWLDPPPKRKPKKKDKETETTDTVANDTI